MTQSEFMRTKLFAPVTQLTKKLSIRVSDAEQEMSAAAIRGPWARLGLGDIYDKLKL